MTTKKKNNLEFYNSALNRLDRECQEMVESGELTPEEADFRFEMKNVQKEEAAKLWLQNAPVENKELYEAWLEFGYSV